LTGIDPDHFESGPHGPDRTAGVEFEVGGRHASEQRLADSSDELVRSRARGLGLRHGLSWDGASNEAN
jgi:hypothetical protein